MGCASSSTATEPSPATTEQHKPLIVVQSSTVEAFDSTDESDLDALKTQTATQNTVIDWNWKPAHTNAENFDVATIKAGLPMCRSTADQSPSGFVTGASIELQDFEETEFDAPFSTVENAPFVDGTNLNPSR
jgi:hypothetical protein